MASIGRYSELHSKEMLLPIKEKMASTQRKRVFRVKQFWPFTYVKAGFYEGQTLRVSSEQE